MITSMKHVNMSMFDYDNQYKVYFHTLIAYSFKCCCLIDMKSYDLHYSNKNSTEIHPILIIKKY